MLGVAESIDIFDTTRITRVLTYLPLAHMFGCGTVLSIGYLGIVDI